MRQVCSPADGERCVVEGPDRKMGNCPVWFQWYNVPSITLWATGGEILAERSWEGDQTLEGCSVCLGRRAFVI